MKTFITPNKVSKQSAKHLSEVALDAPLQWLCNSKEGFKIFGVSAGVVFVVYDQQGLVACQNWGLTPGSEDPQAVVARFVDEKFAYLTNALREKNADTSQFTIYAVGAQESSQNLIDELRNRANQAQAFNFNVDNLHLVSGEDTFDLYVRRDHPMFIAQHHIEAVAQTAVPAIVINYTNQPVSATSTLDENESYVLNNGMRL